MTRHLIETLLPGPLDVEFLLTTVLKFPIVLQPIVRTTESAPDYRLESDGGEIGCGWSRTSTVSGIRYVAVILTDSPGARLSGVAWQVPDDHGRWSMQLKEICTVQFHA